MKRKNKFFKRLAIFICILGAISVFLVFNYKVQINLLINLAKNYKSLATTSQTTYNSNNGTISSLDETTLYNDVIYKNTNTLDIYKSKKEIKGGNPVILYVHGGSWAYGDNKIPPFLSPLLELFTKSGYTIISVDYDLLSNTVGFDKQISDIKDSIKWIYKNKDTYNFDTDSIGVIGLSAGAHLSLMASYSDEDKFAGDATLNNYSCKVKYIIDIFGPTDLSTLDLNNADSYMPSSYFNKLLSQKDEYSPINYVKSGLPSTLIIHSKSDTLVPYENATKLYSTSRSYNNDVSLVNLSDLNHDLNNISSDDIKSIAFNLLKFIIMNT